jgi:threonine synthase
MITLATAHPAKFPDAVENAIGVRPALPPHMQDMMDKPERVTKVPNELEHLKTLIKDRIAAR